VKHLLNKNSNYVTLFGALFCFMYLHFFIMVGNLKGGVVCVSLDLSRDPDYMSIVSERKFVTFYSVTI
jgi:hypothetical protein